jgi:hypothetical protein
MWWHSYNSGVKWLVMSASDNLSQQFFHGTAHPFKEGEILKPFSGLHGPSTGSHVYITSRDMAQEYADMAVDQLSDMGRLDPKVHRPRVFQVEPLGPVEEDPSGIRLLDDGDNEYTDDRRTSHARIIRQVEG